MKRPEKTVIRALLGCVIIVFLQYFLVLATAAGIDGENWQVGYPLEDSRVKGSPSSLLLSVLVSRISIGGRHACLWDMVWMVARGRLYCGKCWSIRCRAS